MTSFNWYKMPFIGILQINLLNNIFIVKNNNKYKNKLNSLVRNVVHYRNFVYSNHYFFEHYYIYLSTFVCNLKK